MSCLTFCCRQRQDVDAHEDAGTPRVQEVPWGAWMGAWKAEAGLVDVEQDRLSRAQAAFGGDTLARIKDINVLIIGCRGVGVETAKNLILSNVGCVQVWDPALARIEDRGANFYLGTGSIGKRRVDECIGHLKSLNPYCKVDALEAAENTLPTLMSDRNVLMTGRGYSVVVVTELLPRAVLFSLNERARAQGVAFIFAANVGVSASIFSDFGPQHSITDEDGEPTQMLAVSAASVIPIRGIMKVHGAKEGDLVVVLTLASDHTLQDGDIVALDDMRGSIAKFNGKHITARRFSILSPVDAKLDVKDVAVKEMLKASTEDVLINFQKQHDHYKSLAESSITDAKFKTREITLFNRVCLVLDDASALNDWKSYSSGGLLNTVKATTSKKYLSLEESLVKTPNPQMLDQEAFQVGEGCWIQLAISAALEFQAATGRFPTLFDENDASKFASMAQAISEERKSIEGACWLQKVEWCCTSGKPLEDLAKVTEKFKRFSMLFGVELTGLCAFLGGVVAQEVLKKTGKFTPIEQWLHHDDVGLLHGQLSKASMGSYMGTRYAHQAAVLGADCMRAVQQQCIFLVGCGALGCEYMKGIALMGACTAQDSKLVVTDMDNIEVSNLSRQFLFRQSDVGKSKSTSAARVVKEWNPELQVQALEKGVGVTTEDFFDDKFWGSFNLCWNALDNVVARKYTDRCCLWYGLPLLESGTLGTKSNSDVFLPKLTKSYNDFVETDTNETQIAMCTLRSFPYLPLHCIEFAKQSYFFDYFEFAPQQYEMFRKDPPSFFNQLDAMGEAEQFKSLAMIKQFINFQGSNVDFDACIASAFELYCRDFILSIRDLLHSCDQIEKSTGKPFWTGTKRRPKEAQWDSKLPPSAALEYLYAAANCYAFVWKVPQVRDRAAFQQHVVRLNLRVPDWVPARSKDAAPAGEEEDGDKVDVAAIETMKGDLYKTDNKTLRPCAAHDFEKDDDNNFHVDFLTVSTNLRAANYDIKQSERSHVKVIAGRIIPALATTTAMICGLVDLEFLKLARGLHKGDDALNQFYNANINLAAGLQAMNVFRPEPALKRSTNLASLPDYTPWDKVEIDGPLTLEQLVAVLEKRFGAKISSLFPLGNDRISVFDSGKAEKLNWKIELKDGKATVEPDAVFGAWPQLRMAVQMVTKLPQGGARKNFESQIEAAAKSLQDIKDTFTKRQRGPVTDAYIAVARPSNDEPEKQAYFDAVFQKRTYIALEAQARRHDGEEALLPPIKYTFR